MKPEDILSFWFAPTTEKKWFSSSQAFDVELSRRFGQFLNDAKDGRYDDWANTPQGVLALVIAFDQFSRNIYRGTAKAFDQDVLARAIAKNAISDGFDMSLSQKERRWLYMPFMHSEDLEDQKLSITYFRERAPDMEADAFAREHHDVIVRFGRFPHRNKAMSRESTPDEIEYLKDGRSWGQ